jgi:hypothetical protein
MKSLWVAILLMPGLCTEAQKRFSEGMMTFSIRSYEGDIKNNIEVKGTCHFKGAHYRSTLKSELGSTSLVYDAREGFGSIHHDHGAQRIMIPLDRTQWQDKNSTFKSKEIHFNPHEDTLRILGFLCKSAIAKLSDSAFLKVYYTDEIIPENTDVEWQFAQLEGLVLSLSMSLGGNKMELTTEQLNFDPVPIQKFDIPNLGYRILDYWESKKLK